MKEDLSLRWNGAVAVYFQPEGEAPGDITVREGLVEARVFTGLGGSSGLLGEGTVRGRLFIRGDRVYVRFTEATTQAGKTVPICMSLVDGNDRLSISREDTGGGPDSARIYSVQDAMVVRSFE